MSVKNARRGRVIHTNGDGTVEEWIRGPYNVLVHYSGLEARNPDLMAAKYANAERSLGELEQAGSREAECGGNTSESQQQP